MTPWTATCQAPLSVAFSRKEYWSGHPLPSPRDLFDPGVKPWSPALQAGSLPFEPLGLSQTSRRTLKSVQGYQLSQKRFSGGASGKNPPADAGDAGDLGSIPGSGRSPGQEMTTHSSVLAWTIP